MTPLNHFNMDQKEYFLQQSLSDTWGKSECTMDKSSIYKNTNAEIGSN